MLRVQLKPPAERPPKHRATAVVRKHFCISLALKHRFVQGTEVATSLDALAAGRPIMQVGLMTFHDNHSYT